MSDVPNDSLQKAPPVLSDDDKQRQILDYINQTLGEYQGMKPNAVVQADQAGPGRAAQLSAISGLGGLAGQGGLDAIESNNLQSELGGMGQAFNAQRQGAQQNFAARGLGAGASGAGLGAGLQASAQYASPAAAAASQAAAASRQRAMSALQQYAQMGGQLRGTDMGVNQLGFQNQLQQLQGKAAARNQLGNYYTNMMNRDRAGSQAATQTGMGAAGLGLAALALL
jgi:hypothetical protein